MSSIEPELQEKIMYILKDEEEKTDLKDLAVLSRVGMKVASAFSAELDADPISASTTALIDLGLRLSEATNHGALTEILLHNSAGYSILTAINDDYVVFGGLKLKHRIGYYLGYVREMAKKLNILISGDEITEMTLSLQESELERLRQQKKEEEEAKPIKPSIEQDKAALDDLLGFLDDWEKEDVEFEDLEVENVGKIVSIPKSMTVGLSSSSKAAKLPEEDLQVIEKEIEQPAKAQSDFKVYKDEIPPVPLEDYTPMEIEETSQDAEEPISEPAVGGEVPKSEYLYETYNGSEPEELPSLDELPSFDELGVPDFESDFSAEEYDTEFVLEEESEALDSVLKELGWEEED